eukprot:bmy_07884T0
MQSKMNVVGGRETCRSSCCSAFPQFIYLLIPFSGFLWIFWQDAGIQLVLSKANIRQQFDAVGVAGSILIFYGMEIPSSGYLTPNYHKHTKFQREKTNNLRNDRERQVAPNVPSAPRKGENTIKMAGGQYSMRRTNATL